jgi:hypothetical protein
MRWTSTTAGLAFAALLTSAAQAAAMPADCSKAKVPTGPVKGAVQGKPFVPTQARLNPAGTMSQDHTVFDTYRLYLKKPEGDVRSATADVTFLVPKGQRPDGRTFRQVPGSISDQPMASEGLPEIQGWSFNDDATGAHVTSVFTEKSSLQVNFAKRMGTKIAGTIYLCAPGDKPFWLGGHFTAEVKP